MHLVKHRVTESLQSLHVKANKHPGNSKISQEITQKIYYPGIAKTVKKWVQGREICIQEKRIKKVPITPELLILPE